MATDFVGVAELEDAPASRMPVGNTARPTLSTDPFAGSSPAPNTISRSGVETQAPTGKGR